jgi:hypothetical protein
VSQFSPVIVAATLVLAAACAPSGMARPGAAAATAQPAPRAPTADSAAGERDRVAKQVLADIAGHENEPAGQVFKNVKSLTAVPAGRLVAIMNLGYGRSLGVSCAHCHVAGNWASDDKPQKQIARDMIQMASTINTQLLANIKNLRGPQPIVNCTTCHRGQVKPALNLP